MGFTVQLPEPGRRTKFKKIFIGLGATLLTIGLVCIILNVVLLNLSTNLLMKLAAAAVNFGTGFWAGGFYAVTGSLAVASGITLKRCLIIISMIAAIICIVVACAGIGLNWIAATALSLIPGASNYVAIHWTLTALSVVSGVLSIVYSAVCCTSGCGTRI